MADAPASQPPAVQDKPLVTTADKTYQKNEINRQRGRSLWFRVEVEGMSPVTAWREVFPNSIANGESCKRQYYRFMAWYKKTYPPVFDEVADALGLTAEYLMKGLKDMMEATVREWDPEANRKVDTGWPDWKVRATGFREYLKLVKESERWRRQFLEQDQNRPTNLITTPEFKTVEEFEAWMKKRNIIAEIEKKRMEAIAAQKRTLEAEGRKVPTPPINGMSGRR